MQKRTVILAAQPFDGEPSRVVYRRMPVPDCVIDRTRRRSIALLDVFAASTFAAGLVVGAALLGLLLGLGGAR